MDLNYSILVTVVYPDIEEEFDVYIPTTKTVAYVVQLLQKAVIETVDNTYQINPNANLVNARTGEEYDLNNLIIDTTIRNGSKLVLE
jgi:hypothetical protein